MGGNPTSAVFSAPLKGGSLEEWVTGSRELSDPFQDNTLLQLAR